MRSISSNALMQFVIENFSLFDTTATGFTFDVAIISDNASAMESSISWSFWLCSLWFTSNERFLLLLAKLFFTPFSVEVRLGSTEASEHGASGFSACASALTISL
uniref:Uncharacterized protein n=1 Tax=Opuntia streptacantha TaxID=393608 RepID=A0A7C9DXI2_OPUST